MASPSAPSTERFEESDGDITYIRTDKDMPPVAIIDRSPITVRHRIIFGIIAILPRSVPRHLRYVGARGLEARFAGDRPVGLTVAELSDDARTLARMIEVGRDLRERDGADVLVMGCAGMARYRDRLQEAVGIPVVEPTQAAVGMAIARVQIGW